MMRINNEIGAIAVNKDVFTTIAGAAATNCFGVKGMAMRSVTDGLVHLLRKEAMSKGVHVVHDGDGNLSIELHIIIDHGVNIPVICNSIMNEVKYVVEQRTGFTVKSVDVYVDSIVLG